jgi:mRNA interferase MazF
MESKKSKIKTNISLMPSTLNGLIKHSIADCLQTRPIDYQNRLISVRGEVEAELMSKINHALKVVFDLL